MRVAYVDLASRSVCVDLASRRVAGISVDSSVLILAHCHCVVCLATAITAFNRQSRTRMMHRVSGLSCT